MANNSPEAKKLRVLWDKFLKDAEGLGFVPSGLNNITFNDLRVSKNVVSSDVRIPIDTKTSKRAKILKKAIEKGKRRE